MKDEKWGEVPCAFIELKDGKSLTENEIISFCRDHLAGFKRPKKVVFGVLPKTATGKIQKYELEIIFNLNSKIGFEILFLLLAFPDWFALF